jgi:hypothetical protein
MVNNYLESTLKKGAVAYLEVIFHHTTYLEGLGNLRKASVSVICVPAEIRTEHLE